MGMMGIEESGIKRADTLIVLDFETTGLSPDMGDRTIEVGAVKLVAGDVVERFQALMNPGMRISGFIESYTGISNDMLDSAPPCGEVMADFRAFIGDYNLVAHNASFDKRFLDAELSRISHTYGGAFGCSLLVSRRLFTAAPNHKLGTLVDYLNIEAKGSFHRALYDAEMTAKLWIGILYKLRRSYGIDDAPFSLLQKIMKTPKKSLPSLLARYSIEYS